MAILLVVTFSILSGFFALCGYSLREFRRSQLEEAFGPGPAAAARVDRLEKHLSALRMTAACCRLGANLVLTVAMIYLFDAAHHGWPRLAAIMIGAWAIIAIFGSAIPHAWAYASGPKVLAVVLGPLMLLRYALSPVVAIMQSFEMPIRRLSGSPADSEGQVEDAKQEILEAATEGRAEGAVNAEEVRMIESVIEFGDRRAGEIMTPRTDIVALSVDTPWDLACQKVYQAGHTRSPVFEGDLDNIIGILYAKDLLQHVGKSEAVRLRTLMRKPFFVPETKRLDDLLREFKARKVHIAVVLDEYGGTAGLVTFEDVLEEIVGEISDEYDQPEPPLMKRLDDASAEVDGRTYIDDLNQIMHLEVPETDDYSTLAGFIFSQLGYIPTAGETLEAHGAKFTIIAADDRKITRVKVERAAHQDKAE